MFFKKKDKPINLNDEANHHLVAGLVANFQANEAEERGLVAAKHIRKIAYRHARISSTLDDMLEANERANKA